MSDIPIVGGSQDGRYTAARTPELNATKRRSTPRYPTHPADVSHMRLDIERYRLETIRTPDGALHFYRHENVSLIDALRALLDNYRSNSDFREKDA